MRSLQRCSRALILSLTLFTMLFAIVQAEEIVLEDKVDLQSTNWSDTLEISQFDPSQGVLSAVEIVLDSSASGRAQFENTGPSTATVEVRHGATVTVKLPDGDFIVSIPEEAFSDSVPPWDGTTDYDGPSGRTLDLLSNKVTTLTLTSATDLAPFIGTGAITFPITATGSSEVNGPGNFDNVLLASSAGSIFRLRFIFTVPNLTIEKSTNSADADGTNDLDVPILAPGETITWTYTVLNTGTYTFTESEINVTDSVTGVIPLLDPASDTAGDGLLSPGETWIYSANGVAQNLATPTAGTPIVQGCDPANTSITRAVYENVGTVSALTALASDPSHYCNPPEPGIHIEKSTNGQDADDANGADVPELLPGIVVTWTYLVENTGATTYARDVITVTDTQPGVIPILDPASDTGGDNLLSPGETWIYRATSIVQNLLAPSADVTIVDGCIPADGGASRPTYENIGAVVVPDLSAIDPSHYCNPAEPSIVIQKRTNGADADDANGDDVPQIAPDATITWTYIVTNTGNLAFPLEDIHVTDNISGITPMRDVTSDQGNDAILSPGESWTYIATGRALNLLLPTLSTTPVDGCNPGGNGQTQPVYENIGTVTAGDKIATDPSHYCNALTPDIVLQKLTNGADADDANGDDVPQIAPDATITWTYIVTNTGNVPFAEADINVTDSDSSLSPLLETSSDSGGDRVLSPGESWLYRATAAAQTLNTIATEKTIVTGCTSVADTDGRSTYENVGTVTAGGARAEDPSHYCNPLVPGIDIEKLTNGFDADDANDSDVPRLAPGKTAVTKVVWSYIIKNIGEIPFLLAEITVADSQPGIVPILDSSSDDGDQILSPGESWIYRASDEVEDLTAPSAGVTVVDGCRARANSHTVATYENIGIVTVGELRDQDPSHYCNGAPTAIDATPEPDIDSSYSIFIPLIQ